MAIPRKGRAGVARQEVQRSRSFVRLIKWRTGSEGRISHLKHSYGWARTLIDGLDGAQTWCGFGVLAHNAVKISDLLDEQHQRQIQRGQPKPPQPTAIGPPPPTITAA